MNKLQNYAKLAVNKGVNIKPNGILIVNSPIECAEFARLIAEEAYKSGAYEVIINYKDDLFTKLKYEMAPKEYFESMPKWEQDFYLDYVKKGASFLSISASDPELLKSIDPNIIATASKSRNIALKDYSEAIMSNKNSWCVISVPTKAWAKKVFPEVTEEEAVEKLWNQIFSIVRADTVDPVLAWDEHLNNLKKNSNFLNSNNFKKLLFKNNLGTNLEVELPFNHEWVGGAETTSNEAKVEFVANIPTEEIFTAPYKFGVNGTVVSSKPLNHSGNLINNFKIEFKDGKVVDFEAKEGYEALKKLLETDENSSYLGEVALVPNDSPISNSNIVFYNTLYDENASCHLAFGKAYPCLKDVDSLSTEDLKMRGINDSLIHVDFMFGTADMSIDGITESGEVVAVFRNGNFI